MYTHGLKKSGHFQVWDDNFLFQYLLRKEVTTADNNQYVIEPG